MTKASPGESPRGSSQRSEQEPDGNSWLPAPTALAFPTGRVDIWRVGLDQPETAGICSVLSSDEITRAHRFHFERDRNHFSRCRSALRSLLARYIAIPAAEIRFEYLANGKPRLAVEQNPRALQFNVSHSAGLALIAFGTEHELGVDIEKIRDEVDTDALAERFFSIRERAGLRALPNHLRVAGFFACWTRKEAFLKATGDGLSFPLGSFSVTTHPELAPTVEDVKGNEEAGKKWFLADLHAAEGYRAAVALDHPESLLATYAWN